MKNTVLSFRDAKKKGVKLTMLTAYDYSTAKMMDAVGINGILVGDSLGMVALGHADTLPVSMEDMLHHTRAVARATENALVISDMPFMSYQTSVYDAVSNAGRLVKQGRAHAVKLEGGEEMCPQIEAIVNASIPVMGHIGLRPQAVHALGGFRVQGRDEETARRLLRDAAAVQKAGAFAVLMECVPARLAALITESLSVPTIGIGSGPVCDGQVLVYHDILGMFSNVSPKFAKQYADVGSQMRKAFAEYADEVRSGVFPADEHSFSIADEVMEKLS